MRIDNPNQSGSFLDKNARESRIHLIGIFLSSAHGGFAGAVKFYSMVN
jgi:hypothetical protein